MASFAPIRGTRAQINATPIVDGQFLVETDQGNENKIYLDNGTTRYAVGGTGYFTYQDNGILGAHNLAYSQENNNVIANVENDISYKLSWEGNATVTLKKNNASGTTVISGSTSPLEFTANENYNLYFSSSANVTNIMLRLATDTDTTYRPYAAPNKDLYGINDKKATKKNVIRDIYYAEYHDSHGILYRYKLNGTTWESVDWGSYSINGQDVWTDGTNIYAMYLDAYGSDFHKIFNPNTITWSNMTWTNPPAGYGRYIWTDGTNVYYSQGSTQKKLNGTTWENMTWSGMTDFYGIDIWTDGTNIYYSYGSTQKKLNGTTWSDMTWSGITELGSGRDVWTDGTNIYYSDSYAGVQKKLNGTTWENMTWSGMTDFSGDNVWKNATLTFLSNKDYIPFYNTDGNKNENITWSDIISMLDQRYALKS